MVEHGSKKSLFRVRSAHGHHRVTFVELFFDLVFVFAITQLSHSLLEHFSLAGLFETGFIAIAVWWVWMYTSWVTNWLDPDRGPVRLMLFCMMFAGLALSTSIPHAFGATGLVFAIAYASMQVGRSLFMLACIPAENAILRVNFQRIVAWLGTSGLLWIAGGLLHGEVRIVLWCAALLIEYVGPVARFWVPHLGASSVSDWEVEGGHMAERCGLFIIIALGESILVTGATFASAPFDGISILAFTTAFIGSIAMWWIYFDKGAELGVERITSAKDPGRLARLAYTYLHLPIVLGIVLSAVGDEMLLAHPLGHTETKTVIGVVGGPLAYIIGVVLFKRSIRGWFQLSHLVGIGVLAILAGFGKLLSPLLLAGATALVLVGVATWESLSLGKKSLA